MGAGPAGLQMAYFLEKANRKYIVLESRGQAASFFSQYPRHEKMISINKRFNKFGEESWNMRHDWNSLLSDDESFKFTEYSSDLYPNPKDVSRYLNDYAEKFQLRIRYNSVVTNISKRDNEFRVTVEEGQPLTSKCVLMATGAMEENIPKIEGILIFIGLQYIP